MSTPKTEGTFEPPLDRRVFCNRTLNMRSVQVVGFDMDYTLVHYDVHAWESRAYAHVQQRLLAFGLPVGELRFDPELFARGLVLDLWLGNIVKCNRFGYVTQASHGTQMLLHDEQRRIYSQVWVELSEPRWVFLNTLFSLSEACIYAQLVELRDRGVLHGTPDYAALYAIIGKAMDGAHLEGQLKAEIIAEPERFVPLDPDLPRALLDLQQAGKRLFLATNSEWHYTRAMMGYTFDRYLPEGGWRNLFDLVIVQSKKPSFFDGNAAFEEVEGASPSERALKGGNAGLVEQHFGVDGADILYVGDHVYADVHVSSRIRRWRTALVLRELEQEIREEQAFASKQAELAAAMEQKQRGDREQAFLRLCLQRLDHKAPLPQGAPASASLMHERLRHLRHESEELEQRIGPLAQHSGRLGHPRWGPLMHAGNDKSRLARQIERHADIYTSRVANLLHLTPFGYLRASRGSLPHDPPVLLEGD